MRFLRAIVLALLLANVGYYLWAGGVGADAEDTVPARVTSSIKLASESAQPAAAPALATQSARMEGTDSAHAKEDEPAVADDRSSALLTNVKRCISIGPFRDVSEAARAATTLRASGYGPRQRVAEGEVWAGVWVYVPRPDGFEAASQVNAALKKGGIDDALEMPGPSDAPVFSLGVFSDTKRAQARVAQAKALGLDPSLSDRKRNGNVFWVDVDLKSTDSLLNPAELRGEAGRITRLEVKACPAG